MPQTESGKGAQGLLVPPPYEGEVDTAHLPIRSDSLQGDLAGGLVVGPAVERVGAEDFLWP